MPGVETTALLDTSASTEATRSKGGRPVCGFRRPPLKIAHSRESIVVRVGGFSVVCCRLKSDLVRPGNGGSPRNRTYATQERAYTSVAFVACSPFHCSGAAYGADKKSRTVFSEVASSTNRAI